MAGKAIQSNQSSVPSSPMGGGHCKCKYKMSGVQPAPLVRVYTVELAREGHRADAAGECENVQKNEFTCADAIDESDCARTRVRVRRSAPSPSPSGEEVVDRGRLEEMGVEEDIVMSWEGASTSTSVGDTWGVLKKTLSRHSAMEREVSRGGRDARESGLMECMVWPNSSVSAAGMESKLPLPVPSVKESYSLILGAPGHSRGYCCCAWFLSKWAKGSS